MLRSGGYFKHDSAHDIYIYVEKMFQIKENEWAIKAKIHHAFLHFQYGSIKFLVTREKARLWNIYLRGL